VQCARAHSLLEREDLLLAAVLENAQGAPGHSHASASVSEYLLKSAGAILSAAAGQRHSICEYWLASDAANMPGAADLIFCDVVAHDTVRRRRKRAEDRTVLARSYRSA